MVLSGRVHVLEAEYRIPKRIKRHCRVDKKNVTNQHEHEDVKGIKTHTTLILRLWNVTLYEEVGLWRWL